MKKIVSFVLATVITAGTVFSQVSSAADKVEAASSTLNQNYAEALQKSLYFYEAQQAGPLPDWNRVEWRSDSTVDDYVQGGWYDAGDHVKFNLPMSYSASMLAWGLYEYSDGVKACGQYEIYKNNLEYVLDYFVNCDLGDEVVYQIGSGQQDHTWWGPVELIQYGMEEGGSYERPVLTGKSSAVCGEMAAALAAGSAVLKGTAKADTYLEHAKNIFEIADKERSDTDYNNSDASGFYRSSHFYDELFWAANWLYIATDDKVYLDKATSYIPNLGLELGTSELKYSWGQCWDDVQQGGMLLYARNTKDSKYIAQVQKHLDYWSDSVQKLDGGLRWLTTWGCLRYAQTAAFLASVACDTLITDKTAINKYTTFAEEQINYALGDNPNNQSYVVGYGENYPKNPHHRTAHSSWNNSLDNPTTNRHILYGALVGGPLQDGSYEDDRGNYINNEVATDYNAGFTAILCKMVSKYGGNTDPDFPEPETRTPEFFVQAQIKQLSTSGVSLSLKFTNETAWPARVVDNMSYRYYMDLSEIIDAGLNPQDVVIRVDRDQSAMYAGVKTAQISKLIQYKNTTTYYIEVTYPDGRATIPVSEGRYQCETMLSLVSPNYGNIWDSSNDYSNADILDTAGGTSTTGIVTDKITVYKDGKLVFGTEPDGTKPDDTPVISDLSGDVNCDGSVNASDSLLLKQFLVSYKNITSQGAKNADINSDKKIDVFDLILLKRKLFK